MKKVVKNKPPAARKKQQLWGDRLKEPPEMRNVAYCAGRDVAPRPAADAVLIPFDVWQNRAHVTMLAQQGIIPKSKLRPILEALSEFEKLTGAGKLELDPRKEDVHTNIEHFIADRLQEDVSGTIHTGRSRNDQTTTVVRLFVRDRLLKFGQAVAELISAIIDLAERNLRIPVAGFTHYQPASVTTMGHWFASYSQALLRDLERLVSCYDRINVSPLGAAASFGTSWPIDRALTARLLGFNTLQVNSLDCVTNRWEMEADAASVVSFIMTHLSIVSQDMIMLSAPQLGIIEIADRYVTGSSIMPQKRNPDFAEVTRAKAALIQNMMTTLFTIARGALSGYNRDTQWTKYLILDIFEEAMDAPVVFRGVFETLQVNAEAAERSASQNFVDAVDVADSLAQKSGLPFRTTYNIVSRAVKESESQGKVDSKIVAHLAAIEGARGVQLDVGTAAQIVNRKNHEGGPAPAAVQRSLKTQRAQAAAFAAILQKHQQALTAARNSA